MTLKDKFIQRISLEILQEDIKHEKMNKKEEQNEEGQKKVLSLLTKDFQTSNAIKQKGINQGLYNNWNTYAKYLEILVKERKAVKIQTTGGYLYKLK